MNFTTSNTRKYKTLTPTDYIKKIDFYWHFDSGYNALKSIHFGTVVW